MLLSCELPFGYLQRFFSCEGIYRGYDGLINDEIKTFSTENVKRYHRHRWYDAEDSRSKEFMTGEGRQKAFETIQKEIDALVVIGGNGSLVRCDEFRT